MQVSLTQIPQAGARRGGAAGSATQILRVCEAQTRGGKWPPACGAVSVRGVGDGLRGADTGRVPAAGGACVDAAEAPASRAEATRQGDSWERELRSPALPGSACAWASRQGPQARGRPPLVLLEASPWPKAQWPRRTPPPAGLRGGALGRSPLHPDWPRFTLRVSDLLLRVCGSEALGQGREGPARTGTPARPLCPHCGFAQRRCLSEPVSLPTRLS